jgi:hypothetical protein
MSHRGQHADSAFSIISAVSSVDAEVQQTQLQHQALVAEFEQLKGLIAQRRASIELERTRHEELQRAFRANADQLAMKATVLEHMKAHMRHLQATLAEGSEPLRQHAAVHKQLEYLECQLAVIVPGTCRSPNVRNATPLAQQSAAGL